MKPSHLQWSMSLPLLALDWAPTPEGSGQAGPRTWDHELREDAHGHRVEVLPGKALSKKSLKEEGRG